MAVLKIVKVAMKPISYCGHLEGKLASALGMVRNHSETTPHLAGVVSTQLI